MKLASIAIGAMLTAACAPALAITPLGPREKHELAAAERTCDTRLIKGWMHRYSNRIQDCEKAFRNSHPDEYDTSDDNGNCVVWGNRSECVVHDR